MSEVIEAEHRICLGSRVEGTKKSRAPSGVDFMRIGVPLPCKFLSFKKATNSLRGFMTQVHISFESFGTQVKIAVL